jgi:sulfur carrier protein ThiS
LKIHVKILPKNITKEIDIKIGSTMFHVLKKIDMKPDNVIILRDNTPVPVDESITKEENLTIIQVASGG